MSSLLPPNTSGGGVDVAPVDWSEGVAEFRGNETLKRRRLVCPEVAAGREMGLRNGEWRTERCGVRVEGFMGPSVMG